MWAAAHTQRCARAEGEQRWVGAFFRNLSLLTDLKNNGDKQKEEDVVEQHAEDHDHQGPASKSGARPHRVGLASSAQGKETLDCRLGAHPVALYTRRKWPM
eukprot:6198954-Pleurochrysis_carterae.AAC.1